MCVLYNLPLYTIQWFLGYSELCNYHHDQFWNIFITTKETSYFQSTSSNCTIPLPTTTNLLYVDLSVRAFYVNGINKHFSLSLSLYVCVCVGLRKESSYNKIWIRLLATTLWNWKKILLTFWLVVLIELGCYLFVTLALRQYFEKAEAG